MNRVILTDIDGTVLRFDLAFERWMGTHRGMFPWGRLRDLYRIGDLYRITEAEVKESILRFCHYPDFENLPAEECAREVLPRLHAEGWQFVAITAVPESPLVAAARMRNLKRVFGFDWVALHCTGTEHGCKADVLASYPSAIWVEDHWDNAVLGAERGHTAFVLDRSYNAGFSHPGVRRVVDWHEVARLIS